MASSFHACGQGAGHGRQEGVGTWAGPQDTLPASWGHQPRERLAMLKEQVCFREQGREEAGAWGPGEGAANAPGPFPTAGRALLLVSITGQVACSRDTSQ